MFNMSVAYRETVYICFHQPTVLDVTASRASSCDLLGHSVKISALATLLVRLVASGLLLNYKQ